MHKAKAADIIFIRRTKQSPQTKVKTMSKAPKITVEKIKGSGLNSNQYIWRATATVNGAILEVRHMVKKFAKAALKARIAD